MGAHWLREREYIYGAGSAFLHWSFRLLHQEKGGGSDEKTARNGRQTKRTKVETDSRNIKDMFVGFQEGDDAFLTRSNGAGTLILSTIALTQLGTLKITLH